MNNEQELNSQERYLKYCEDSCKPDSDEVGVSAWGAWQEQEKHWNTRSQEGLMEICEQLSKYVRHHPECSKNYGDKYCDCNRDIVAATFSQWKNERGMK